MFLFFVIMAEKVRILLAMSSKTQWDSAGEGEEGEEESRGQCRGATTSVEVAGTQVRVFHKEFQM